MPASVMITYEFDSNISKLETYSDSDFTILFDEITQSGTSIDTILSSERYVKVYLANGYVINTVTSAEGTAIDNITANSFHFRVGAVDTITVTSKPSVSRKSVDLTTLAGWGALSSGTHNITLVAKANGYRDSAPSAAVQVEKAPAVVMPNKGDIITMDAKQYRVLKLNGTVAEILCMYNANSSVKFDSSSSGFNSTYAEKNIDTYCNNTFYNSLSAAMKSAIVDKTFTQDSWTRASSVPTASHYTGKYDSSTYYLTLANAAFGTSITRHCYCLSLQDVLDYLEATTSMGTSDTTLTDTNIWKMFWNATTSQSDKYIWLRSAGTSGYYVALRVRGNSGDFYDYNVQYTNAVRPAFQIDLSKVEWSK